jgi:uncharacterized protein YciU (UPF0263 family)
VSHQYARRTYDEASVLARESFQACARDHLQPAEIEELKAHGLLTGGTPGAGWEELLGFEPTEHSFYELQLYKPSAGKPFIEKSYVRMLAPRDRASSTVLFIWRQTECEN